MGSKRGSDDGFTAWQGLRGTPARTSYILILLGLLVLSIVLFFL
jgi:hypothetical protein